VTIAQTSFVSAHPGFAPAWQDALGAVNQDVLDNFDAYTEWVAQTDGVDVELVRAATERNTFNTEPFPAEGLSQLQSALDFLVEDGSIQNRFDVTEWAGRP
jgi:sulfonate transport system substrate-binding protein